MTPHAWDERENFIVMAALFIKSVLNCLRI